MPDQPSSPIILIVEDNPNLRASLRTWLEFSFPKFEFLATENGEGAILLTKSKALRLILMDIVLPGMNGIEAARQIKAIQPEVKIVIVSIHDQQQYQEDARNAGASAYLSKSKLSKELLPIMSGLLEVEGET